MKNILFVILLFLISCSTTKKTASVPVWQPYDETELLAKNANNKTRSLRYKRIQSKIQDKNAIWKNVASQLNNFTEADYQKLKPLILNQDIPTLQSHVKSGDLSYERLTQWYLYRIMLFENDKNTALNNIISINPNAVKEARKKDKNKSAADHPLYGIPVLLKDNINVEGMVTTAGAAAFANNVTGDAFITERIKAKGGIILGKTNLSEWANYLCSDCPNGYSAMGGQTLNPYGLRIFDTGGSSSGSGSAMAANYAAASVGTETSGSILSPSSAHSLAGLKPTTGLLSRSGIVPISSTFDTPGPMTRNITDNAILLSAMLGVDASDPASKANPQNKFNWEEIKSGSLKGIRFGVYKNLLADSLYKKQVDKMESLGAIIITLEPEPFANKGFGTILDADMKQDVPAYIKNSGNKNLTYKSIADIMAFNSMDSSIRIPYGQGLFAGIVKDNTTKGELENLKTEVRKNAITYLEKQMQENKLDMILSIANRQAGLAAAANYPCLTVSMGYRSNGEPAGITFIARPWQEIFLLKTGYAFEQATKERKMPEGYQ